MQRIRRAVAGSARPQSIYPVIAGGPHLHGLLLLLGMVLLFRLLLAGDLARLAGGSVPAAGEAQEGAASEGPGGELAAHLTPVTQGAAMDGFAAWSPDGKAIAFMRDGQILLAPGSGRPVRVLTSQPSSWDAGPAWRPDGRSLAFVRLSTRDSLSQVMELTLDEGGRPAGPPRVLAREPGAIGYLAWDPTGSALYYTTSDRIVRVTGPGKREVVFRAPEGWELISGGLAVSRDGRWLIFGGGPRRASGVEYDLYRVPAGGGEPERLTTEGGIMPGLHPGGQLVAYRNPRTATGIYLLNLATGTAERLLADDPRAMYFHPQFSPDGRRLLVSRLLLAPRKERGQGGFTSNIYVYDLD
ncbi:Tol biopolymer transport system component [Symbiobacterium terraclitae]|uniref:Tol biopolymer transport system component n=1 Tax=Symbiobacterium terraclitae TaxID=557451 RepID=A0ABS4JMS3_9FIRM|nr:PD40 domain-containing protein [Symbiobacterium terraclitae]MBP2016838.1 Tol biopolymer transport system component [Symbiobacterium terraclitae]